MNDNFSELKDGEKQGSVSGNWMMGAVIIAVGAVLLLRNLTGFEFENWWILFLLVPIGGMVMTLWRGYQANGRLNTGSLIGLLSMGLVMTIFLFDLSWGAMWPAFFMLGGVGMLLNQRR